MLKNMLTSSSVSISGHVLRNFSSNNKNHKLFPPISFKKPRPSFTCLKIGVEEIAELAHNKAFVAVAVSTVIGQFSKPFTSALSGNGFNARAVFQSGGMPSTHSAGVVAVATSLGLERGFSDTVFGMAVVYAAIVMYDAQGVRREAGYHAKVLNQILWKEKSRRYWEEEDGLINSRQGTTSSVNSERLSSLFPVSEKPTSCIPNSKLPSSGSENIARRRSTLPSSLDIEVKEVLDMDYISYKPLKEYVGHTELEVIVGAFLGFVVSIAMEMIL